MCPCAMDTQGEDIGEVVHLEFDRTGIGQKVFNHADFFTALQEQWHKSENIVLSDPPAGALNEIVKEKKLACQFEVARRALNSEPVPAADSFGFPSTWTAPYAETAAVEEPGQASKVCLLTGEKGSLDSQVFHPRQFSDLSKCAVFRCVMVTYRVRLRDYAEAVKKDPRVRSKMQRSLRQVRRDLERKRKTKQRWRCTCSLIWSAFSEQC